MNLRQKIGQLFMVGFDGTEVSPDLADFLTEYQPGGLILFRRNLEKNNVSFYMEASVSHASASTTTPAAVGAVHRNSCAAFGNAIQPDVAAAGDSC